MTEYDFNPFAVRTHNGVTAPRVVNHLAHALCGAPLALVAALFHPPMAAIVVMAILTSVLAKCLWVQWHSSVNPLRWRVSWSGFEESSWVDFSADTLHTVLGALANIAFGSWTAAAAWLAAFYVGSIFADPY